LKRNCPKLTDADAQHKSSRKRGNQDSDPEVRIAALEAEIERMLVKQDSWFDQMNCELLINTMNLSIQRFCCI
jgi:hypothetical protein